MSTQHLLPDYCKKIGWILLVPAAVAGFILSFNGFESEWISMPVFAIYNSEIFGKGQWFQEFTTNATNTIVGSLFIIGGLLVSFSKEKTEDEFIGRLRLSSLLWAVWVNYILLLIAMLFVYGSAFLTVMVYNMFTVFIIFITRFQYLLYKNSKYASDEK